MVEKCTQLERKCRELMATHIPKGKPTSSINPSHVNNSTLPQSSPERTNKTQSNISPKSPQLKNFGHQATFSPESAIEQKHGQNVSSHPGVFVVQEFDASVNGISHPPYKHHTDLVTSNPTNSKHQNSISNTLRADKQPTLFMTPPRRVRPPTTASSLLLQHQSDAISPPHQSATTMNLKNVAQLQNAKSPNQREANSTTSSTQNILNSSLSPIKDQNVALPNPREFLAMMKNNRTPR
jgi:hypothetical protein